jgi:hypothetical protein
MYRESPWAKRKDLSAKEQKDFAAPRHLIRWMTPFTA